MPDTPILLLVHGAWHGAWVWDQFGEELPDVPTITVDLPSAGSAGAGLADDVAVVRAAVAQVDGPVVVVAHCSEGLVASGRWTGWPRSNGSTSSPR